MLDHPNRLPIEECQQGHAYVLCSRNLLIGVCLRGLDLRNNSRFRSWGFVKSWATGIWTRNTIGIAANRLGRRTR